MSTADLIHPGEHLAEILEEFGISQYRLAKTIGTSARGINEIVHDGRRSIRADTALRIGQALGMTPEFWLNMQDSTSFEVVETAPGGADQGGVGLRQSGIRGGTAAETRAEGQTCGGQRAEVISGSVIVEGGLSMAGWAKGPSSWRDYLSRHG